MTLSSLLASLPLGRLLASPPTSHMPRRRGTTRGGRGNLCSDRGSAQGRSTRPYPAITLPGRVTRSRTMTDAAIASSAITPDPVSNQQSSGRIADYSLEDFMQLIRDVVREEPQNQISDGTASVAQDQPDGPPPPPPPPISGQGALE